MRNDGSDGSFKGKKASELCFIDHTLSDTPRLYYQRSSDSGKLSRRARSVQSDDDRQAFTDEQTVVKLHVQKGYAA